MSSPCYISYRDIKQNGNDHLLDVIEEAFGKTGLGLVVIKDVPDFSKERMRALLAIRKFADLPEAIKEQYTHPKSNFSFGWSHGKERLRDGVPDKAKGSYYANPLADIVTEDMTLKETFPELYCNNIWPTEHLPELEHAFKAITKIQLDVGYMMCQLFDTYLHKMTGGLHQKGSILDIMKRGTTYKGRLLHYFPTEPLSSQKDDGLCGWHLDHGGITILTCPLYLDTQSNQVPAPEDCGLHIKHPADGSIIKVLLPEDCILVQLGESLQFLSGGHLRATPHCVKSSRTPNITRETIALFMDWSPEQVMKLPEYSLSLSEVLHTPYLPDGVPDLQGRMEGVKVYRDFSTNTFRAYYNNN